MKIKIVISLLYLSFFEYFKKYYTYYYQKKPIDKKDIEDENVIKEFNLNIIILIF